MFKKKVIFLFFPQFIDQFKKFNDSIYSKNFSEGENKKKILLLSKRSNEIKLLDDDMIDELDEYFKKYFDISYIDNPESLIDSLESKIFDFHSFVLVNYPRNEEELSKIIDKLSKNNKFYNDDKEDDFSLDFGIIFLYIDYETIKEISGDSVHFFQKKNELFNKEITLYLDLTKRIIEHFINLNNGNSSKVSVITIKKDDLLSGKAIKEIWNSIV